MWRRGCDLSANERAREPSDKERHDTIRHKSIHVLLTAYYIAVKCVWGKKTHNDGIIAAVSCGWHEHLGTKKKPKKNAYRKCVFFSASCVMLCGVNRGNILPLQATQRWVPNAPTYDYLIYQIQMIFTFYILHFFICLLRAQREKATEVSWANWPLCSVADNMISFVVIQLEDWIHISFVNKRRAVVSITAAGF